MEKPKWSQALLAVLIMGRELEIMRETALDLRCLEEDSGGARCTADASPEHAHRHELRDLP